jgi:hypothetical protein
MHGEQIINLQESRKKAQEEAENAIERSKRVGRSMRADVGAKGNILDIQEPRLRQLFPVPTDYLEALRLQEIVRQRSKHQINDYGSTTDYRNKYGKPLLS